MKKILRLLNSEVILCIVVLLGIVSFAIADIVDDIKENESLSHIRLDVLIATFSIMLTGYLMYRFIQGRSQLTERLNKSEQEKAKLRSGLSDEIETAMQGWRLSQAEREVGLLLLKGLSLKEIAAIRKTSERTVRHQSLSLYSKANVAGRAELSAFFLEDFLDRSFIQDLHN